MVFLAGLVLYTTWIMSFKKVLKLNYIKHIFDIPGENYTHILLYRLSLSLYKWFRIFRKRVHRKLDVSQPYHPFNK